ncbi:aldo/keto reductase [Polynucleobacter paneuropaeus]|nr:aldo/keto reductase [Polynucleobacter paneuropaeus]
MRLALGTVQFGLPYGVSNINGQVTLTEAIGMIEIARKSGVDMLDTAVSYGQSESCLGRSGVKDFKIITKLPEIPVGSVDLRSWILQQVNESCLRMGVDSLYGVLLHRPQQLLEKDGLKIFHALSALKAEGMTRKIGISIYSPKELDSLFSTYHFDLVQAPFNLVDRRLETSGWLERLKQVGVEIHVRSVFMQGLLLMPKEKIPKKFLRWEYLWDCWHSWLNEHSTTSVQACLGYASSFSGIDRILVGAENKNQLTEILKANMNDSIKPFPEIGSEDEFLVNPVNWGRL